MKKLLILISLSLSVFASSQPIGTNKPYYVGQYASDPSGTHPNGTIYYNTTLHAFMGMANGTWSTLGGSGSIFSRELKFKTGITTNAPDDGDSILVYSGSSAKKLNVYREGELQFDSSSANGYERSGDTVKFHPPLLAGERVIIHAFDTSLWSYDGFSTPPPAGPDFLVLSPTQNITESPTGTWTSTNTSAFGVANTTMAADGSIQAKYNGTSNAQAAVGLDLNSGMEIYSSMDYGMCVISGTYYKLGVEGTASTGVSATAGDLYRISRVGSTVTAEYSTTGGASWTVAHTFSNTTSATLYGKIDIIANGNVCAELRGTGF